jgi:hypothetical protein
MPKVKTLTQCWADDGVKPTNVVWSWTACDKETKRVAMTFWTHEFEEGQTVYRSRHDGKNDKRRGYTERLEHLEFAKAHCNSEVAVILITVKDTTVSRWRIIDREVVPWRMKIADLDTATGRIKMVRVKES